MSRSLCRAIANRIGHGSSSRDQLFWNLDTIDSLSAVKSSGIRFFSVSTTQHARESRAGGSSPEQQEMSFAERLAQGPGLDDFIKNNNYSVYAPNPKVGVEGTCMPVVVVVWW